MEKGRYVHASPPQPVGVGLNGKGLYRDEDPSNIMYDRRIVRGNTYAAQVVTQQKQRQIQEVRNENERRLRREAQRRRRLEKDEESRAKIAPVEGRRHCEVQTDKYLEVLSDKPLETDIETQTDDIVLKRNAPREPLYMPAKTGVDVETEIVAGELFDFDLEVEPLLEVLVGKTLQAAMLEVIEEEELANIRARQIEYEEMKQIELAEVQRLNAQATRREAEKERRLKQETERLQRQAALGHKIAAQSFAKNYFSTLADEVFDNLVENGFFLDPILEQVETQFMPWLFDSIISNIESHTISRACTDALIASAIKYADSCAAAAVLPSSPSEQTTPHTAPQLTMPPTQAQPSPE